MDQEQRRMRTAYRLRVEGCKLRREELLQFIEWHNENMSGTILTPSDVDEYIADKFHVSKHEMGVE